MPEEVVKDLSRDQLMIYRYAQAIQSGANIKVTFSVDYTFVYTR